MSFGAKPFRFENTWMTHPSFTDLVACWWQEVLDVRSEDWERFKFMNKLQHVKQRFKVWNKVTFGNIKEKDKIWLDI